jgi:hypothetical protein
VIVPRVFPEAEIRAFSPARYDRARWIDTSGANEIFSDARYAFPTGASVTQKNKMLQSDRAQSPVVDPPGLQTTATRVSTKGAPAPVYAHECLTRCDRVHWRNLRWRSRRIAFARPKYEPEGIESNLIRREEIFADETSRSLDRKRTDRLQQQRRRRYQIVREDRPYLYVK